MKGVDIKNKCVPKGMVLTENKVKLTIRALIKGFMQQQFSQLYLIGDVQGFQGLAGNNSIMRVTLLLRKLVGKPDALCYFYKIKYLHFAQQ